MQFQFESWDIVEFFSIRAGFALLVGLILGIERTISAKSAGIKTLVFVSIGSCFFTTLSFYLSTIYHTSDPTRIIGQIVTGIGFLCAGVIFQKEERISGLTSSSIIWVDCALGTLVGSGLFLIPLFGSIALVIVMFFLRWIERVVEKFEKSNKNHNQLKKSFEDFSK